MGPSAPPADAGRGCLPRRVAAWRPTSSSLACPCRGWDLTAYFPSLQSREFAAAQERLGADVERMVALYDHHGVRGGCAARSDRRAGDGFVEVLDATNDVLERLRLLSAYVSAFVTTDARDDAAAGVGLRAADAVGPGPGALDPL